MKEFTIDIPEIVSNEGYTEHVSGFNVKEVTVTTNAEGSKVRIRYEEEEK